MKHVELTFFFFPKVNEMISYEQSKKEKRQTTITILCVWLVNNKMIQKKKQNNNRLPKRLLYIYFSFLGYLTLKDWIFINSLCPNIIIINNNNNNNGYYNRFFFSPSNIYV